MIKINNEEYNNYTINITWGEFSASSYGRKRKGIAPFITFNINDKIHLGLELTFSDQMFKSCKISNKIDISSYLSDICYEDEKGWLSIITGTYTLYITKITPKNFIINLRVETGDINIIIESTIPLFK